MMMVSLAAITAITVSIPVLGQQPNAESKPSVTLVSDTCSVVHEGDTIALDWNPGFEHAWAVTAVDSILLSFAPLDDYGVTVRMRNVYTFRGKSVAINGESVVNGYFHFIIPVLGRVPPGIYRLVDARVAPQVLPDYDGAPPAMTVSPVRERYCITVVSSTASQSPQPGS
jgi:hypothetical protein